MAGIQFPNNLTHFARAAAPLTAAPFTMLLCAQSDLLDANDVPWIMAQAIQVAENFRMRINSSGNLAFIVDSNANSTAQTTNSVTVGVPFVGIVRESSSTNHYVLLNGDTANAGLNTVSRVPLGIDRISFGKKDDDANNQAFSGVVFYAALWSAGLSDAELQALSRGAWPANVRPRALHCFWPDWQNRGGLILDWCKRCNLTLTGGVASTASARRSGPDRMMRPSDRTVSRSRITTVVSC